ncbi:16S rRNA (adenine(1518)-N(6)/adenine(1519)-N(6))-dimethyltransferase RsmA [Geoglobus acetivorans]|uniref:Probable ribosomal RNA small subunit methyltransferase A n=1 Tax=Geoglobus acetivorans TaxID=565033 RepID=A0ABZ3H4N0_GEOAI|nr:ribosomal RNA small subunit methyltransferase A [Geoglobus acetivorans]
MKFSKKLGQHILIDRGVVSRIIRYAELKRTDTVLEVGCGTGILTEQLLKHAGKVYGIEKDKRFVKLLENKFLGEINEGKFVLIEGDALKVEWPEFNKFVSNIPYQISSELTFRLLKRKYELAVVMYQKEFAERLVARSGKKYGRLSVVARAYATIKILEHVKAEAFRPKPKVDSSIVIIKPIPEINVKNMESFEKLVREAFSSRRKKFGKTAEKLGIDVPEDLKNERPERIPPEVFAELSKRL